MLSTTILSRVKHFFSLRLAALIAIGRSVPKPLIKPEMVEKYRKLLTIEGSGIQISYLENGSPDGQLYVMVHGTPGAATGWADYIQNPPAGSQIIAIDRPGFGKSTTNRSFQKLTDQLSALRQIIPIDKTNIILIGHSLGGPIVAQYAVEYPEQVQSVIFLASSLDPALEKIHPLQYVGNWAVIRPLLPTAIRNANEELMTLKPQLEALSSLLNKIKAKIVIVHGDKDKLVPVENVEFLKTHLTSAKSIETIIIPGKNHFLPWNSEATVREAMQMAAT